MTSMLINREREKLINVIMLSKSPVSSCRRPSPSESWDTCGELVYSARQGFCFASSG